MINSIQLRIDRMNSIAEKEKKYHELMEKAKTEGLSNSEVTAIKREAWEIYKELSNEMTEAICKNSKHISETIKRICERGDLIRKKFLKN